MKLKLGEIERGWVLHACPVHGPLVACTPRASVFCGSPGGRGKRCNKRADKVAWTSAKPLQNKG
jgi:hypothetical protein